MSLERSLHSPEHRLCKHWHQDLQGRRTRNVFASTHPGKNPAGGTRAGRDFSVSAHKTFKTKRILTAVPPTGRELRGHEEGKPDLGKLQSSPRERDLGGKTSREAGKQPGVLEVHHTQWGDHAEHTGANPSCHTHSLLHGTWGQQHWLKKEK